MRNSGLAHQINRRSLSSSPIEGRIRAIVPLRLTSRKALARQDDSNLQTAKPLLREALEETGGGPLIWIFRLRSG